MPQDDVLTRSQIMARVKSRDTTPEMRLRRALWHRGLRYRVDDADISGRPDLVFYRARLAVFVDGDYWHGNQWRCRGLRSLEAQFLSTGNASYWLAKIGRNIDRDRATTWHLLSSGWRVLRLWESQVKLSLEECVAAVTESLSAKTVRSPWAVAPALTVAEFFAGIGLMRMGLDAAGWRTIYANDIDPQKLEMYSAHFGDVSDIFELADVHKVRGDSVPSCALATASFPCTDLSLAGAREGLNGRQSSALWGFVRVLSEMGPRRPPLVMLENVPGFLTSHGGDDFQQALQQLNELGYSVDAFMVDAARFVPQSRLRLFVVGTLPSEGIAEPEPELPFASLTPLRPEALLSFIRNHSGIRWSLRPLPSLPEGSPALELILEDLPDSAPEWWSQERAAYLLSQMSLRHRAIAEEMIQGPEFSYGTVFRRVRHGRSSAELRTDGIAGCLRTPKGGSAKQILFRGGKGTYAVRLLTPRECARLMGADDYSITVNDNQALFGFGDAVCVPVVAWVARNYLGPIVDASLRGRLLSLGGV